MKHHIIFVAIIALLIGGIGGYMLAGDSWKEGTGRYEKGMNESMERHGMMNEDKGMPMMDHSAMMVQSEQEFVVGMIPHHQEAVDTAKEVLARGGTTEEIRTLAENIILAQEKEIVDLKAWHEAWYGEPYQENGEYMHMMRDLSQLSGVELDRAFLEDMIPHHMGAIMMANSVRPYIEHDEVAALADAIFETQTAEIDEMKRILETL